MAESLPELRATRAGVVLEVHVQPGASREGIVGRHGERCKVAVSAPPQDGKANDAVVRAVADAFELPVRDVTLVRGHRGRQKQLALAGIGLDVARRRLAARYGAPPAASGATT